MRDTIQNMLQIVLIQSIFLHLGIGKIFEGAFLGGPHPEDSWLNLGSKENKKQCRLIYPFSSSHQRWRKNRIQKAQSDY